jgi:hypothetical protein
LALTPFLLLFEKGPTERGGGLGARGELASKAFFSYVGSEKEIVLEGGGAEHLL